MGHQLEPLDLIRLFSAPSFLSEPRRLLPALPFLFLVLRNPRLQRVEFVAFRDSDIAQVEERRIASQLFSQSERLALLAIMRVLSTPGIV